MELLAARRAAAAAVWWCALLALAVESTDAQSAAARVPSSAADTTSWPSSTSWRHIGPAAFGGRVDDIEAVASDPRTIFVASASGGVFRSHNNGITWDAVFDTFGNTLSIGDIAIAPSNPQTVWAGTGEPNNRQSSTWGDGVYRSRDGGTTWQHMGLRETQSIGRIVIDPHNPDIVFVAAVGHLFGPNEERGLYRTTDGGTTWKKVLGVDANTGATDVVISPDGRTLVAAMYQRRRRAFGFAGSGPGSGLWRSTNGGDSWQRITTGMPTGDLGRIGLDISASNPNIVYAVIEAFPPGGGVYRSDDAGATWTRQSGTNQRGNYFSQIRVDPVNPNRVWLLAVALIVSNDAGKTFSADSIAGNAHPDHHAMWIDPHQSAHILLGNDGGVYFTYDAGRNWNYIDNLPIAQFYDIVVDNREPYWLYGGAQDNGSWAFPSATYSRGGLTNTDVQNTGFGDGFQAAVDPLEPRFVYANSQNGRAFLSDMVTREEHFIQPVAPAGADPYRFNWNTAVHLSPNNPKAYYMGAQKLLRTVDRGTTWQEMSPDLSRHLGRSLSVGDGFPAGRSLSANDGVSAYGNITTIAESPKASGTIYIGTDDGNVGMTVDGGTHWTDITSRFPVPERCYVSKVFTSRHDARVAYVAFDGHWDDDLRPYLFRTPDGGATWTRITNGIPNWKPVKTLEEDPVDPALLFAGTEFGLYWSTDTGDTWTAATGNVPPVLITKIIVNPRNNDLVLATHGRGVLILEDIAPLRGGKAAANDVVLFPLRAATLVQTYRDLPWPAGGEFVARNSPIGTYISYAITSDPPAPGEVLVDVLAPDGSTVQQLHGSDTKGTHRLLWDLRYAFRYVPPAADSGFYGPPRAPYVPPGQYTVRLTARGHVVTQNVDVRADARGAATREGLRQRIAINRKARDLSRVYADVWERLDTIDTVLASMRAAAKTVGGGDSLVNGIATTVNTLRQRARGNSIVSGIGRVFDLTAAIESSSMPPTAAQQRSLQDAVSEFTDITVKLNEVIASTLPALRTKLGGPPSSSTPPLAPVTPPQ